jgi:AcrR family transcriptional regulator
VANIEAASGLKPGSGALFSHFPTKEAVLEAAIEEHAATAEQGRSLFELARLGDLRSELTVFARGSLMMLDNERDLVRLLLKEADQFPQLRPLLEQRVLQPSTSWLGGWLRGKVKAGELDDHDGEAVAVIAIGSLVAWWLRGVLGGESGRSVDEDRFVAAWVDLLLRLAPRRAKGTSRR